MTAEVTDLDDSESLQRADTRGVLRSAASAGAQVRAMASAVSDGELSRLDGLRPRSVVLVTGRGGASRAAAIFLGALAGVVDVPVVRADRTPTWTGSLDLVVVAGDDAGDPVLAQSIADAVRRGAETVVTAPEEGPVAAAGAGYALRLPPRVSVLDTNRMPHHLAAILAVLAAVRAQDSRHAQSSGTEQGLEQLADVLDGEVLRDSPSRGVFRNAAKTLAARIAAAGSAGTVLAGDSPGTVALAQHAAAVLLSCAGVTVSAVELIDALSAPLLSAADAAESIFHDPQLDEPTATLPLRVFVLASAASSRTTAIRMSALPQAELVLAGDEPAVGFDSDVEEGDYWRDGAQSSIGQGQRAGAGGGSITGGRGAAPAAELDNRPEITQLAVLAARWELVAAYMSLVAAEPVVAGPVVAGPNHTDLGR